MSYVICSSEPIPINDERFYLSYALEGYKMKQNCFIDSLTLVVGTKSTLNSSFRGDDADILRDDYKIKNIKLSIFIENSNIKSNSGKKEFYGEMSHELQHVYRFYCILLSNNANYSNEENVRMIRNKIVNNIINDFENGTPQNNVSKLYYFSDKNEISSETNRLYEFIRSNKDVNYENYHLMQENFPLYILICNLKIGIDKIENGMGNEKFVNEYGNICKTIIGDTKLTTSKALIKFRTRLLYSYIFALRNYRRTLIKAFEDFDRMKTNFNEKKILRTCIKFNDEIENKDGFNQLKEILDKH